MARVEEPQLPSRQRRRLRQLEVACARISLTRDDSELSADLEAFARLRDQFEDQQLVIERAVQDSRQGIADLRPSQATRRELEASKRR
jgi:D-serine deaminase-like pyridoxal phosphate-dependent protein